MTRPHQIRASNGRQIELGKELGRGGEGNVYEVRGAADIAAKLYHQGYADSRAEKIIAMTSAKLHTNASNIAFPIDSLFDTRNQFVGFTMRRVGGHQPIHNL